MRKILIIIVTTIMLVSCDKNNNTVYLNDWDEDISSFSENLKKKHKNLFFKVSEEEFDQDISDLKSNSGILEDAELMINLCKLIAKVGDSHTGISLEHFTFSPFNIEWVSDGIYLSACDDKFSNLLGLEIEGIGGHSMETIIDSFRTVIPYENESAFKLFFAYFIRINEFHQYFNFSDSADKTTLNLEGGISIIINKEFTNILTYSAPVTPLFLQNRNDYYWFEELLNDSTLYIQYNSCREKDDLSFQSFTNQITNSISNNQIINKLVLDLRHNGGGNSSIAKPLIDEIESIVSSSRLDHSKIYVIIGKNTFSSALLNAIEMQNRVSPILIGEPTGGKPNHYGEVKEFSLPNSKLKVRYSSKYFEHSSNNENSLYPDVSIDYSSEHFLSGIDPVLEYIINN